MPINKVVYGNNTLIDLTNDSVSADKMLVGTTAHNKSGEVINGTIQNAEQAKPSISIDDNGLITATSTQSAGYVVAGTKKATKQLSTKGSTTYIPTTSDLTIPSGLYLTGKQIIKGDSNLKAENIKKNISIFGITGTYEGSGSSGSGENTLKKLLDYTKSTSYMFYQNKNITDLTGYINYDDTENVLDTSYMFYVCSNLTTIPQLNTSKVANMSYMFYRSINLKKIDISYYNISSTSSSEFLCYQCGSLKAIIIRSFGSNYVLASSAFEGCYHLIGRKIPNYNPNGDKDGFIYVPRSMVDKLKSATNWSTYASQIRALEDWTVDGTTTGEFDESKEVIENKLYATQFYEITQNNDILEVE